MSTASMSKKTRTTGSNYSKADSTTMPSTTKASSQHGGKTASTGLSKAGSVHTNSKAASSNGSVLDTAGDHAAIPSFWSIWTTRRMARQLTSRIRNRRKPAGSDRPVVTTSQEPTYCMEPKKMFNSCQVEKVIGDVLEAHLHDFTYDAKRCNILTRIIVEEIKDRVKALRFERYKIVCAVTMGEKRSQDLRVASRCVWDAKFDTYSTYNWENGSAFCSVTVFGIYHE